MSRRLISIAVLPALFTLGNLICGFFAIVVAARIEAPTSAEIPTAAAISSPGPVSMFAGLDKANPVHNCMLSGWLIFLAMVFDALDGQVARLTRVTSDFGAQLDSLCDVVTFGVAPAFLLVKMCPTHTFEHSQRIWLMAAFYACCAAVRLARFNAETDENDDHLHFTGLPSPAAAASIAGFAIMFYALRNESTSVQSAQSIDKIVQMVLPFFGLVVAGLMVSRIPYPHVVNQLFRGQRSMGHLIGVIFAIMLVMAMRYYALPIICVSFVLSGPILFLWQVYIQRKPQEEPIF
jgi:CDP-diacylglycerol--serine O-phosphatidyltransferase